MSRIDIDPRLPAPTSSSFMPRMFEIWRKMASQLNMLSEGGITAVTNATTAAPTAGSYQVGDFVRNSSPSEAGIIGSKYVVLGWVCTVAGTPGTFLPCRVLTGN